MRIVWFGALLLLATAAQAAPSVFVKRVDANAWWYSPMEARILGKHAGPISIAKLSKHLQDTMLYSPYEVCSLEAVANDTFVGLDRTTQTDIEATVAIAPWRLEGLTPDGRRLLAQSVLFESCDGELRGASLLVTDAVTEEILRWEPLGDWTDGRGEQVPSWVMFLSPKEADELFSFSGCTECGARTNVYYDVTRRGIYTEYNGH